MSTSKEANSQLVKDSSLFSTANANFSLNMENYIQNNFSNSKLSFLKHPFSTFLKMLLHEKELNDLFLSSSHLDEQEFLETIFEYFNISYSLTSKDRQRIPATGRVIIVANNPLGCLDGLILLKMVKEIRPDVKILSNEVFSNIPHIRNSLIAVNTSYSIGKITRKNLIEPIDALENEQAVIVFPAGIVSCFHWKGILDREWKKGFLRMAKKTSSPIIPIYIDGHNSFLFYSLTSMNNSVGLFLSINEIFKNKGQEVNIKIGKLIPYNEIMKNCRNHKEAANEIKNHVYSLSKKLKHQSKIKFKTLESIVAPNDLRQVYKEIKNSELLGKINDKKSVYLFQSFTGSFLMKEIGRLREVAFRLVNEGTGKKIDTDIYDQHYQHIILWEKEELEVIGSYRVGDGAVILAEKGLKGFYSSSLFDFSQEANEFFRQGLELGRSFLQPKYWGQRGLDYLWQGIGAYLVSKPNIRYLFGPVSISGSFPKYAKDLIVAYYQTYFNYDDNFTYAKAKSPYTCNSEVIQYIQSSYPANQDEAFKVLRQELQEMNVQLPALYKLYTDLCYAKGVMFWGFNIDADFQDTVDGFIVIDLMFIKEKVKSRYLVGHPKLT